MAFSPINISVNPLFGKKKKNSDVQNVKYFMKRNKFLERVHVINYFVVKTLLSRDENLTQRRKQEGQQNECSRNGSKETRKESLQVNYPGLIRSSCNYPKANFQQPCRKNRLLNLATRISMRISVLALVRYR